MLTQEQLRELFSYDPDTGILDWKDRIGGRCFGRAGTRCPNGTRQVYINHKRYREDYIIWIYITGREPIGIEHINGELDDNRWNNLKEGCTKRTARRPNTFNPTGYRGVVKVSAKRWKAQITFNGERIYLGLYDSPEAASNVYQKALKELEDK